MLAVFLPFILATQGFIEGTTALTETIKLSDTFSVVSEYVPAGSTLTREAMVMSVEDFAIVQAEVEVAAQACQVRLDDLITKQQETIKDMQQRCSDRNAALSAELKDSVSLNKRLTEELKRSESNFRFQRWVNIGLLVGAGVTTTIILTK